MNKKNRIGKNSGLAFFAGTMAILTFSLFGAQNAFAALSGQLDFGDRGSEVTELQTYLSTDVNIYPSGLVTGYFGQLTKAGVERFQTLENIVSNGTPATTGYGRVGPLTRAAINAKLSGGGSPVGDVWAPTIQTVGATTGNNDATIYWTASESSFGKVYYSTSPIRINNMFDATGIFSGEPMVTGTLAQHDNIARAAHTVTINGLTANTTYYYLVVIYDASRNVSITLPAAFRTL
jgi:hypothetical protein